MAGGMAPVPSATVEEREGRDFPGKPPATFNLIAKRSRDTCRDLIRAPGHFYKFPKISYRLDLTFRPSTKIGEVK